MDINELKISLLKGETVTSWMVSVFFCIRYTYYRSLKSAFLICVLLCLLGLKLEQQCHHQIYTMRYFPLLVKSTLPPVSGVVALKCWAVAQSI
jgi:hypothetical protein